MAVTVNNIPPGGGGGRAALPVGPSYGTMGSCLALLRVFLGVVLFTQGLGKWHWITRTGLGDRLTYLIAHDAPLQWYIPFLENSVTRHIHLFTWLVVFGELILGLLLVFGLYTRLASFFVIIMLLNYLFSVWHLGSQWQIMNEALIAIAFTCMSTGAGRIMGLDFNNAFKNPKSFMW